MTETKIDLENAAALLQRLEDQLNAAIAGQQQLIRELLVAVFAGGHVLLEGLPGLGKTQLVKSLAGSMDIEPGRVQCTPDLLPADITGSEILRAGSNGTELEFRTGPVFANLLLVDEINRATPRTQSALLEAMQEQQVTHGGRQHALPDPFWVVATQNPIELEGTFPLPEAQLDRFLCKLVVPYPKADQLQDLLDASLDSEPSANLSPLLRIEDARQLLALGSQILLADEVRSAAIRLVLATQPDSEFVSPVASEHIRYGASPRALLSLIRGARIRALFDGRAHTGFEDLAELALPVMRHRILLQTGSELDGNTSDSVLTQIVDEWSGQYL